MTLHNRSTLDNINSGLKRVLHTGEQVLAGVGTAKAIFDVGTKIVGFARQAAPIAGAAAAALL